MAGMASEDDRPTAIASGASVDRPSQPRSERLSSRRAKGPGNWKTEVLEPQRVRSFAWLVVTTGYHAGCIFPISGDVTTVGRDSLTCDITIDDDAVSLQHFKIRAEKPDAISEGGATRDKQFYLYDLATTNGTKVNGERVLRHALRDGDRIEIGRTGLAFKEL